MFDWYRLSDCCYVYLSDVPSGDNATEILRNSRWFTRGWTLQEFLAPATVVFFAQDWTVLGCKAGQRTYSVQSSGCVGESASINRLIPCHELTAELSQITSIPIEFLTGKKVLRQACVSQRMFWAASRRTTKQEDRAYSLMGLFDISMPILYGEGLKKAFVRLQREIISRVPDQTILVWHLSGVSSYRLIADSPDCFGNSGAVMPPQSALAPRFGGSKWSAFSIANLGLRITIPIMIYHGGPLAVGDVVEVELNCVSPDCNGRARTISPWLVYLDRDFEGTPIFMCHSHRNWKFASGRGKPMRVFICRNDNAAILIGQSLRRPTTGDFTLMPQGTVVRVMAIIEQETGCTQGELLDEMFFTDIGVDSLMALTIVGRLREETQIDVHSGIFIDYAAIGAFKAYIAFRELHGKSPTLHILDSRPQHHQEPELQL